MSTFHYLLLSILVSNFSLSAQNLKHCCTDEVNHYSLSQNPSLYTKKAAAEAALQQYYTTNSVQDKAGSTILIPIVFHIIHQGGNENISNAQVLDALQLLNQDFRNLNPRASQRPFPFDTMAADMDIEFRLATKDPDGNCTDGIDRVYSSLTQHVHHDSMTTTELNLKGLSRWPTNKYLNIWVVSSISDEGQDGVIGYARYPYAAGPGQLDDGVVIRHDFVGSIGTALTPAWTTANLGATLSHEIGHWLGLIHPWGGEIPVNCGNDQVYDTPQQVEQNWGCRVFPYITTCNGVSNAPYGEMFMNFMDYTDGSCQNMFSKGQKARVHGFMNTIRNEIWSPANLVSTGISDVSTQATNCMPRAYFYADKKDICTGESVTYYNNSYNGTIDSLRWYFTNGTPSTSTNTNPTVTYNTAGGNNMATLKVYKNGLLSNHITDIVYVQNTTGMNPNLSAQSFENNANTILVRNEDPNTIYWKINTMVGNNSNQSFYLPLVEDTVTYQKDAFISSTYDMNAFPAAAKLYFDIAYARKDANSNDKLLIYFSSDCGANWNLRYSKAGNTLKTAADRVAPFVPTANEWRGDAINIPSSYLTSTDFRYKFELLSWRGNNIYIDNIRIEDPATAGITTNKALANSINVYPNPATDRISWDYASTYNPIQKIELMDISGKILLSTAIKNTNSIEIPANTAAGVYTCKIVLADGTTAYNKLIIQ